MAKRVVSLYLDDSRLWLLETRGHRIKEWADSPLEPGLVRDGVVVDEAVVAGKIVALLKSRKVRAKKVVAGLSGIHGFFKLITLPDVSGSLLSRAVKLEAEKALPIPLDQLYLSWQILSRQGGGIQAFLAAVPRSQVDALVKTMRAAGLNPYLIDLKPLALSRAADREKAIIADLQPAELNVVVMVGRVPRLVRTVSLDETKSWTEKLSFIREELERTVKYYNSSQAESQMDREVPVLVSQELAAGLALNKLASILNHPVSVLGSPFKCPNDFPAGHYLVNIGLALKVVKTPGRKRQASVVNINALPLEYRPRPVSWAVVSTVASVIMAIGLLVPLVGLVRDTVASVNSIQVQLEAKKQFVTRRQKEVAEQRREVQTLEGRLSDLVTDADRLESLSLSFRRGQEIVNGDLAAIRDNLTVGVLISSIDLADDRLLLDGEALGENSALAYARRLRDSQRFSRVVVTFIEERLDCTGFRLTLNH